MPHARQKHAKQKAVQRDERRIIERPRLLRRLEDADARTILLVAPAGYGKTILAQQWSHGRRAVAWYTATEAARDVAVLSRDIAETVTSALGSSPSRFGEFLQTIDHPARDARRIVHMLTEAIACSGLNRLVIDDYQLIAGSPQAEETIDQIRKRTTVELVITSRIRPSWVSARGILYGEIHELTRAELAMTSEESRELLGSNSTMLADIAAQACGWPAVLGLAALAPEAKPPHNTLPFALYDFFADELFRSAEPSLQDALMTFALLPCLTLRFVGRALGAGSETVLAKALKLGAISETQDRYEIHPLFREFLIVRLQRASGAEHRVRQAIMLALEEAAWDTAFQLVRRFELPDLIEPVLCAAYRPLLKSGRIGALAEFDRQVRALGLGRVPALDLIAAEVALREGRYSSAEETALRVARQLGDDHSLLSHAYSVGGQAAFAAWETSRAEGCFRRARTAVISDEDESEAVWGLALTRFYGETSRLSDAVAALEGRRDRSPVDLVRHALAQLAMARVGGGLRTVPDLEDALHVTRSLDDPRVRTSFEGSYSYYKGLQAQYAVAAGIAREALSDARAFELSFVAPHLYWNLALACLGLRQFAEADKALQQVEKYSADSDDPYHVLNARCLRARTGLSLNQADRAREEVGRDSLTVPMDAIWQEYQATKALTHAVALDHDVASACAREAAQPGAPVEARALAAMATAVMAAQDGDQAGVTVGVMTCSDLGTWDPFVCAVRAYPSLLAFAICEPSTRTEIGQVLSRSRDFSLARSIGLRLSPGAIPTSRLLSPREREVFELVRNGMTNREIARALFISELTAKVHVHHVMKKLNARTRTEAASRVID